MVICTSRQTNPSITKETPYMARFTSEPSNPLTQSHLKSKSKVRRNQVSSTVQIKKRGNANKAKRYLNSEVLASISINN